MRRKRGSWRKEGRERGGENEREKRGEEGGEREGGEGRDGDKKRGVWKEGKVSEEERGKG